MSRLRPDLTKKLHDQLEKVGADPTTGEEIHLVSADNLLFDIPHMSESKKDIFETYYNRKLSLPNNGVIGYKIIPPDWTCKNKKYECPGRFFEAGMPVCGLQGMHFCENLLDCFAYYPKALTDPNYHVCKVSAIGYISAHGNNADSLMCTNELKILRELTQEEIDWEFNQAAEFNKVPILLDGGLNENNNHRI